MADSSKEQIEIAKQLLDIARETQKINREQSEEFSKQLRIMQDLLKTIQDMKKSGFDDIKAAVKQVGEQTSETKDEAAKFKDMLEEVESQVSKNAKAFAQVSDDISDLAKDSRSAAGSVKELSNSMKEAEESTSFLSAAWSRLTKGLSFLGDAFAGLGKAFLTIIEYTFKLGVAIVNVAVSAFQDFMDYAQDAAQLGYDLARAIEKVRQNFGDLAGDSSKAVTTAGRSMAGFAETGLSAFQVFGNQAQQMEAMNEMAMALGGTFFVLTDEVKKSGGAMLAFQKGLGLSNEAMKGIASLSIATGKSFKETSREIEKFAIAVAGKSFKPVSRAIGQALTDVAHFGGATIQQIGQAAKYAHTLGVELDKIVGTLDAFETFDSAADNAARLSQSFGVTVDAFKLMEAQSPDEILSNLREQFAKAGVDSASFNRQQLKMISSMTGLDAATAKQVFSLANQGESLDKIKEKGDAAAKTQLTQQEAMKKLADSIERLVVELPRFDGLFDAFFKGIVAGLFRTGQGQEALQDMMKTFQKIFQLGLDLGQFIANIPEVKQFFSDIGVIILNLSKPFEIFSKNFKLLFQGKQGFGEFWYNVTTQITNAFSEGEASQAFSGVMGSLKKFAIVLAGAFGGFLNGALGSLGSLFSYVAKWLSGDKGDKKLPTDQQASFSTQIWETFSKELTDQKNIDNLKKGFGELKEIIKEKLRTLWNEDIKPWLKTELSDFISYIGDVLTEKVKTLGPKLLSGGAWIAAFAGLGFALKAGLGAAFSAATTFAATKSAGLALDLAVKLDGAAAKAGPAMSKIFSKGSEAALKVGSGIEAKAAARVAAEGASKVAAKAAGKGIMAKVGGKLVPGLGIAVGGYELFDAWKNRGTDSTLETVGKVISGASSIASVVPGVGTAVAVGGMLLGEGLKILGSSQKTSEQVKEAQEKIDESKSSIKALTDAKTIDELITAVKNSTRGSEITDKDLESFKKLMDVYETIGNATNIAGGIDITKMVTGVGNVSVLSTAIANSLENVREDFSAVVANKLTNLQTGMSGLEVGMTSIIASSNNILSAGLEQSIGTLGKIIGHVNVLNQALSTMETVDVVAKVGQIATALGVGGSGEYKVTKGDVNLTVNFTVVMDVDKTEKVMIMRKESIIRDRLNDAQSSHMSSEYEIPDTYSPSTKVLIADIEKAKTK